MQLVHMKMESQVIVNQHVTVNKYLSLVHTARHMQEVFFSQDSSFNANQSFFWHCFVYSINKNNLCEVVTR